MYSVLIVDDEEIIRKGLCHIIDWEGAGFTVAGAVCGGAEALEFIKKRAVDVVLTDIRMPHMSGIDLIRNIYKIDNETKAVIVSGYNDFDYAQKAIQYGAFRYILKPTQEDEVLEVFSELKTVLDQETDKKKIFAKGMDYKLNEALLRVVSGEYDSTDIDLLSNKAVFRYVKEIAILKLGVYKCFTKKRAQNMQEHIRQVLSRICDVVCDFNTMDILQIKEAGGNVASFVVLKSDKEGLVELCHKLFDAAMGVVDHIDGICLSAAMGEAVHKIEDLNRSRMSSESRLSLRFNMGTGKLITSGNADMGKAGDHLSGFDIDGMSKDLCACLAENRMNHMKYLVDRHIGSLGDGRNVNYEDVSANIFLLLKKVENDCLRRGLIMEAALTGNSGRINEISEYTTSQDLCLYIVSMLEEIRGIIDRTEVEKGKWLVKAAIQTIEREYSKELTLAAIADSMQVTSEHLSRTFKKETGRNFKDFLLEVRMEEAKKLLNRTYIKVYEIAQCTGYRDNHHFSVAFKNYTGITPSEYRKRI